VVLRAEGLGKRYRIGAPEPAARSRLQAAGRWLSRPARRAAAVLRGRLAESSEQEFWALRDLSFEVTQGEIVGLLGENGAGKTTLLRLASGITRPTTGRLGVRGRVGSLLEVSIGFHPELTGRENVYLYGAILGLRRAEVAARFDAIVDFAGVGRFLDTQMKFFSTGMFTRLAFAVATELAPDVLLVDEVLSVSDFAFRQRSLDAIARRARAGGTVLFVSHNLRAMEALCTRCLLLEAGRLVEDGPPPAVLRTYRRRVQPGASARTLPDSATRPGTGTARIEAVWLHDPETAAAPPTATASAAGSTANEPTGAHEQPNEQPGPARAARGEHGEPIRLDVTVRIHEPRAGLALGLAIRDPSGALLGSLQRPVPGEPPGPGDRLTLRLELPPPPLRAADYSLVLWLGVPEQETCDRVDGGLPTLPLGPPLPREISTALDRSAGAEPEPSLRFDPLRPIGPVTLEGTLERL
jgi:ABC-type polysaccharide/polyol phosphate transport system ATPase subunit